jgi:adenylate cyclase
MAFSRRLAAIFVADAVGYSRLMGIDEEGTHTRVTAHLREVFGPKIEQHSGRIVKSTGDGVLAEFPSVVEAVLCAVEAQIAMSVRYAGVTEERMVAFRIGINVGDVIAEPEDIFGDGVNIATRLEGLAEPNGICISRAVHEQVRDKLSYRFDDLGPQSVKNIPRPVRAFALRPAAIAELPMPDATPARSLAEPAAIYAGRQPAPRLSSVVLPFTNLSDDREDQYFADAITDDVTTDLSRIAVLLEITIMPAIRDRSVVTSSVIASAKY